MGTRLSQGLLNTGVRSRLRSSTTMRFDAPHLDAEPPQCVQTAQRPSPWVECDSQAHEEILRAIHPSSSSASA